MAHPGRLPVNAGAPPLSAWLPDAYPEASWSGMVFLSAFTTKTAVYVLLRGFPGTELLVYVGLFMVFYGIVYALLENDMRRILAYSIVNQVGFMVAGIGIGTEMALNGAAAHAFTHILYKALLLMSAGSVLLVTGRRKCTDLGGLFRSMPFTTACGIIGALAISSFPADLGVRQQVDDLAGRRRRAPLHGVAAARRRLGGRVPARRHQVPLVRVLPEGLGAASARAAVEHAARDGCSSPRCASAWASSTSRSTACCPIRSTMRPTPAGTWWRSSSSCSSRGSPSSSCCGWLRRTLTITLDFDWAYRVAAPCLARLAEAALAGIQAAARAAAARAGQALRAGGRALVGPGGLFARTWPSGSMALGMMLMLLAFLLSYYLL